MRKEMVSPEKSISRGNPLGLSCERGRRMEFRNLFWGKEHGRKEPGGRELMRQRNGRGRPSLATDSSVQGNDTVNAQGVKRLKKGLKKRKKYSACVTRRLNFVRPPIRSGK
ncbi:hypothetical protein AVEN_70750-1 [Araneus ventricosus]|uniref:Uncharacterized protein n=1 Tax=Araneus ventricosus TaxID=182803 RepID=A0A4Y2PUW9_ARAVE|nr:hypothetical protein AVEN_70750-1 [Araneus ventricosus]